jgi:cytochrome c2
MKTRWHVILASAAALAIAAAPVGAAETATKAAAAKPPGGKELFISYKCTSCHSIETEKIEKKKTEPAEGTAPSAEASAPQKNSDLSGVGAKKDAAWISKYLMKEEKLEEKLHKTKFKGTPEELKALSSWLASLKQPAKGTKP